jgi:hypothetical protein
MHRLSAPVLAGLTACAGPAATHAVLVHPLLDSETPLAPRLGPDEVRAWVSREHYEPDTWVLDRGDLLGAR